MGKYPRSLSKKMILISGSSGGVGSVLATKLSEAGANLILIGRNETKLNELAELNGSKSHKYYICDYNDQRSLQKLIQKISSEHSQVDIIFNIAGVGIYKNIDETTLEEWSNTFNVNVTAPFLLINGLLPLLQKDKNSKIINIGSGAGTMGMKGRSGYVASKFALRGLSLSLSEEFRNTGPKVVLITLGSTLTNFGPLSLGEKKKLHKEGKAYFTPEWVVDRLIEIITGPKIEDEYVLYPSEHGMGEWKKP